MPSAKMTDPTGTYSNYSSPKVRGAEELPRPKVAVISSEARYVRVCALVVLRVAYIYYLFIQSKYRYLT